MEWYQNYWSIVLCIFLTVLSFTNVTFILAAGKTRNMPADLHLLVQVFCCRVPVEQAKDSKPLPESSTLLCSVHNMIFFAAHVLSNCKVWKVFTNVIKVLDNSIHRIWFSDMAQNVWILEIKCWRVFSLEIKCWRVFILECQWFFCALRQILSHPILLSHLWVYLLVKPPVYWQYTCYLCSIYINPCTYPIYNDVSSKSRYM